MNSNLQNVGGLNENDIYNIFNKTTILNDVYAKSKLRGLNFSNLSIVEKQEYLRNMKSVLELLITRYNGKYGAFSKPFNNQAKLIRRINVYCDLLTANINNHNRLPLLQPAVIVNDIIQNEKSTGIKGGIRTRRKNRRNRRKTSKRRTDKTRANRKRRSSRRRK